MESSVIWPSLQIEFRTAYVITASVMMVQNCIHNRVSNLPYPCWFRHASSLLLKTVERLSGMAFCMLHVPSVIESNRAAN